MSIITEIFKKLAGAVVKSKPQKIETWADYDMENRRRAFTRSGNFDWQGLPIDRHAGKPVNKPQSGRFRDKVADFLDMLGGVKVEPPRNPQIPVMKLNLFDGDVAATEFSYLQRRLDNNRIENNDQSLGRDSGSGPRLRKHFGKLTSDDHLK
jgi:hypothetical protein